MPAYQGIPLTKRGASESFWVITGTTKSHQISKDIALAAQSSATVVILMGMGKLSEIVQIFSSENKHLEKLLMWKRFIDDIWSLFKGSEEEAKVFVNWLNNLLLGIIKFIFEYSTAQAKVKISI